METRIAALVLVLAAAGAGCAGESETPPGIDAGRDAGTTEDASARDASPPGEDAAVPDAAALDGGAGDAGAADAAPMDAGPGVWMPCAALPRGPRQETAVVSLRDRVYVLGGFDGAGQVLSRVEVYDPLQDRWSDAAELPVALHHANAAVLGDRIYVLGFLRGSAFTADARGFVYDPGADRWDPAPDLPAGTQRGASGVAVAAGRIFVAGGFRGGSTAELSSFEPGAGFSDDGALDTALDHLVAAGLDDQVYIAGGRGGGIGAHRPDVRAYDPGTGMWRDRAPMITSRAGAAAAVLDGKLYVFGGEGNPAPGARGVFSETEVYDPVLDRWTALAPMPIPRHGTGAAAAAGRIVVPGGATVQAFGAVATCEQFFPP